MNILDRIADLDVDVEDFRVAKQKEILELIHEYMCEVSKRYPNHKFRIMHEMYNELDSESIHSGREQELLDNYRYDIADPIDRLFLLYEETQGGRSGIVDTYFRGERIWRVR